MRIRLNRNDATVYQDLHPKPELIPMGHHLDGVILWYSKKFHAKMFDTKSQDWVQITMAVKVEQGWEPGYFLLNSGTTNALFDWEAYVAGMEQLGKSLDSVITRVGFQSADVYYDYKFQPFEAPKIVAEVMQWREANLDLEMIDEVLDPNVVRRLKQEYRASQAKNNNHVGLIL